ncbi:MAG: ATP synthase protein I [Candidatus Tokpelaia hoelldobleri]|uniref:ATP synthase protein I n=1 Tax=Candidatus Tokpelaia hoelldobleri TaxID=1902579 RepID=A0A1U9JW17_9HYPH|nr:MAG: ATP synthase protein I [Candidatus Tokpelaia hoelldoblerii]
MAKGKNTAKPVKNTRQKQDVPDHALDIRRLALERKLKSKGRLQEQERQEQAAPSGFAQGLRLSSEFLAAIVVGVVLGLGLDQLAGTKPWGLIFFLFIGFAAGVLNVLRSTGRVAPSEVGKKHKLSEQDEKQDKGL